MKALDDKKQTRRFGLAGSPLRHGAAMLIAFFNSKRKAFKVRISLADHGTDIARGRPSPKWKHQSHR